MVYECVLKSHGTFVSLSSRHTNGSTKCDIHVECTLEFLSGSSLMSMAISIMGGWGTPRGVGFIWSLSGDRWRMWCSLEREA